MPCLGCNEVVDADDLVRSDRVWSSSIFWYPYHFWCIRDGAPAPCSLLECAECGAGLDVVDVCTVLHWASTFLRLVYADWLEQRGDLARAIIVRLAVERRKSPPAARGPLNARLREARLGPRLVAPRHLRRRVTGRGNTVSPTRDVGHRAHRADASARGGQPDSERGR